MSKVKITGNASGTGTLTIAAPNTNTDRTLTLPDGAGELVTNSYSGSVTISPTTGENFVITRDSGGVYIGNSHNGNLRLINNNTERMRLDTSGNLLFNSGYGSVATAYGCRAWVNFDGSGTVAIRESGNVSSITDNGVGYYSVNFATAMPDANYTANVCPTPGDYTSGSVTVIAGFGGNNANATGSFIVTSSKVSTGSIGAYVDVGLLMVSVFR